MQQKPLAEIIKDPFNIDSETITFLEEFRDRYPYCQTVQVLLAKGYQKSSSPLFEKQVNLASAYSVDRHRFQNYISEKSFSTETGTGRHESSSDHEYSRENTHQSGIDKPETGDEQNQKEKENIYAAGSQSEKVKTDAASNEQYGNDEQKNKLEEIVTQRLGSLEKKNDNENKKETPVIPSTKPEKINKTAKGSRTDEIIDKFIREEPTVNAPKKTTETSKDNLATKSGKFYDDIVSETLAEIYLKQGKTDRAINIYNKLSLQFPEKNCYFAKKIEQLKRKT